MILYKVIYKVGIPILKMFARNDDESGSNGIMVIFQHSHLGRSFDHNSRHVHLPVSRECRSAQVGGSLWGTHHNHGGRLPLHGE